MRIIQRNVSLKHLIGTIEEINLVSNKLGITTNVIIKSITNWIFHVDVLISIIIEGEDNKIDEFENLIN